MNNLQEKTLTQEMVYRGKIINLRIDQALSADGRHITREVVEHPGGVVILPVLEDGRVVFVEQWRYPLERTLLELPAGKLDSGERENPLGAAQRELREETGYTAARWEALTHVYTAPGFCDEILWLYRATELTLTSQNTDEDEIINVHCLTKEEILQRIQTKEIVDAKTLSLLWFYFFQPTTG